MFRLYSICVSHLPCVPPIISVTVSMHGGCDLILVIKLLHPAPNGDLHNLQTGNVNLLDETQDARQDVGVLKQSPL